MFRELIPALAGNYYVIAPDYLGFGLSDTPPTADFGYTFDALAELTSGTTAWSRGITTSTSFPGPGTTASRWRCWLTTRPT